MRGKSIPLLVLIFVIAALIGVSSATAQSTPLCPAQALLSIARAGSTCANLDAGTTCYASGSVTSTVEAGATTLGLTQLGDRVSLHDLSAIQVTPGGSGDDAPLSIASLVIKLSPSASDQITVLLIQDADLQNQVTSPVEIAMQAVGTLHVRAAPSSSSADMADLAINDGVTANGRSKDGDWLRVIVPATGDVGWVSATLVKPTGKVSIDGLPTVDSSEPVEQSFQVVDFTGGVGMACDGALEAGALLQTPSTDLRSAATISLSAVTLRLAGTTFITESKNTLTFRMLDGSAELSAGSADQFVPAGASATFDGSTLTQAVPYDTSGTAALTLIANILPRSFQIIAPQSQSAIDAQIAALTMPTPTLAALPTTAPNQCQRTIGRRATISSGPGLDYEVLTTLDAGTVIHPVLASTDPLGAVWWQLDTSGWVARADTVEHGNCSGQPIPVAGRITAPPTNTYSLEKCESLNGPVRSGQTVTFEFVPPAWDNFADAIAALQTDPGHFTINSDWYYADASDPIPIGENTETHQDRYVRQFTMVWTAAPGIYRITGDWLSYAPQCNLTVPVE